MFNQFHLVRLMNQIKIKPVSLGIIALLGMSGCSLNMKPTEDQANQNIKTSEMHIIFIFQEKYSKILNK